MLRCNFPNRREINKKAAEERQKYRATQTPTQQLKRLDERLGAGMDAQKERARLQNQVGQKLETAVQFEPKNKNRNKKNKKN